MTFIFFAIPFWKIALSVFVLLPTILKVLVNLTDNHESKQKIFSYFFKGMDADCFNSICVMYSSKLCDGIFESMRDHLHDYSGFRQVIVSASISNWIIPFAVKYGIRDVIGTEIEVDNLGKITGFFSTKNCNNQEKVNRILHHFTQEDVVFYIAVGNSKSDIPMLMLAENKFFLQKGKLIRMK